MIYLAVDAGMYHELRRGLEPPPPPVARVRPTRSYVVRCRRPVRQHPRCADQRGPRAPRRLVRCRRRRPAAQDPRRAAGLGGRFHHELRPPHLLGDHERRGPSRGRLWRPLLECRPRLRSLRPSPSATRRFCTGSTGACSSTARRRARRRSGPTPARTCWQRSLRAAACRCSSVKARGSRSVGRSGGRTTSSTCIRPSQTPTARSSCSAKRSAIPTSISSGLCGAIRRVTSRTASAPPRSSRPTCSALRSRATSHRRASCSSTAHARARRSCARRPVTLGGTGRFKRVLRAGVYLRRRHSPPSPPGES